MTSIELTAASSPKAKPNADGVFGGPAAVFSNDRSPRLITPAGRLKSGHDWEMVDVKVRRRAAIGARTVCLAPKTSSAWRLTVPNTMRSIWILLGETLANTRASHHSCKAQIGARWLVDNWKVIGRRARFVVSGPPAVSTSEKPSWAWQPHPRRWYNRARLPGSRCTCGRNPGQARSYRVGSCCRPQGEARRCGAVVLQGFCVGRQSTVGAAASVTHFAAVGSTLQDVPAL